MKKILVLVVIVFGINFSFGQRKPREKVKALKIAYITDKLDLSSNEAQQFWPIYNEYEATIEGLKKNKRASTRELKEVNGYKNVSEKEAEDYINNYLSAEEQKFIARKKLITSLRQVLPHKKILKLVKAEIDFNKRLLQRLRNRRERN